MSADRSGGGTASGRRRGLALVNEGSEQLPRVLLPMLFVAASVVAIVTAILLGPVAGIKSTYPLIGITLAGGIYYGRRRLDPLPAHVTDAGPCRLVGKAVFLLLGVGLLTVLLGHQHPRVDGIAVRTAALLVCLPIGYLLVAVQIHWRVPPRWGLAQIIGLFAFSPILQYATTGFYFDRGDTTAHVYWIETVVAAGSWRAIPDPSHYTHFPGLHTMLAAVSLSAGVPAYDAYLIVGILACAMLICTAYCLADLILDRPTALAVAFVTTMLAPITMHATYFYPQVLGTIGAFLLLFVAFRAVDDTRQKRPYRLLAALLVPVLIITHHLTVVLFIPVSLAFLLIPELARRLWPQDLGSDVARPSLFPLAAYVLGSVVYWIYHDIFLGTLLHSIRTIMDDQLLLGGDDSPAVPLHVLGARLSNPSVFEAIESLAGPEGIYQISLVALLAIGVLAIIAEPMRYRSAAVCILLGIVGAVQLVRLPVVIPGFARIGLMLSVFTAFLIGIGLVRHLATANASGWSFAPVFLVIVLLGTSAPLLAANDIYAIHDRPGLWETQSTPDVQREFTQGELHALERASLFVEREEATFATDWHSRVGFNRFGAESEMMHVNESRIEADEDLLLYRDRWSDHSLQLIPEEFSFVRVVVDEEWKNDLIAEENKVYAAGDVGMLADRESSDRFVSTHESDDTEQPPDDA